MPSAHAERLIAAGVEAEKRGNLEEALARFREAARVAPRHATAHLNLGIGLEASGDAEGAIQCYETALRLDPREVYARYNLGKLLFARSAPDRAAPLLMDAVRLKPDFPEALVVLAAIQESLGSQAEALATLQAALRQRPDDRLALRGCGLLLGKLGRWSEAESCLRRAIATGTDDAEAACALANALVHLGRTEESAAWYRAALRARPDYPEALSTLGCILVDRGKLEEARPLLARAIELRPALAEAHVGLGNLHHAQRRPDEAAASYRRAIALDARFVEAHCNLGHVLVLTGQPAEALAAYDAALSIDPEHAAARWARVMCRIAPVRAADEAPAQARIAFAAGLADLDRWFDVRRSAEGHRAVGVQQPFWLAYHAEDNLGLLRPYGALCARLMAAWQKQHLPPPAVPTVRGARVRVGVVSQYFCAHSVWDALTRGWFERLDPRRIELLAFNLGSAEDADTSYARSRAARFVQGAGGLQEWAEAISAAAPDVLIYPEIGMDPMTVKLASLRLAPLQAASWGHPETTGLPTIDCFLSAQGLEPDGAQAHYSERLVPLPNLGCSVQPPRSPAQAADLSRLGLDPRMPLLVCPGTPFKYAPEHDATLCAIAHELDACQFVFFTHWAHALSEKLHARLAAAFASAGLNPDRHLRFLPWLSRAEFHALMRRADLCLDSIGFSGFNTALQALECSVPIVTCEGRFLRGRLASGILRRIGLHELVASDERAYVATAVELARDASLRQALRPRIESQRHALYADPAPIRALEAFLLQGR
ncbi:MAG TPA: tetratricopeptide repeat protein [Burkholderiales bacterium]|nr:tetratricopeptide repeat protein [Burkholderiales bacterium]